MLQRLPEQKQLQEPSVGGEQAACARTNKAANIASLARIGTHITSQEELK